MTPAERQFAYRHRLARGRAIVCLEIDLINLIEDMIAGDLIPRGVELDRETLIQIVQQHYALIRVARDA